MTLQNHNSTETKLCQEDNINNLNNTQESQGEHLTLSQLEERVLNVEKNISFEGKKKSKVNEIMKVEYRYLST